MNISVKRLFTQSVVCGVEPQKARQDEAAIGMAPTPTTCRRRGAEATIILTTRT